MRGGEAKVWVWRRQENEPAGLEGSESVVGGQSMTFEDGTRTEREGWESSRGRVVI